MTRRTASGNITASALPANPTRNQRDEMKTKTYPLRRSFLLATLASTFLLPTAQAAKLVTDHIRDSESYTPVCQKILDTIHATPDFFPRLDKEGYPYILYHSPFKRQEIQKTPAYVVYPLMLESRAFSAQRILYTMTQYGDECKNYPENDEACDKVLAERMAGIFKNQHNYLWFKDGVIDHPKGFAYKTATHLLNDPAIEEYLVGALGYGKTFGVKKGPSFSFALAFITDRLCGCIPQCILIGMITEKIGCFHMAGSKILPFRVCQLTLIPEPIYCQPYAVPRMKKRLIQYG